MQEYNAYINGSIIDFAGKIKVFPIENLDINNKGTTFSYWVDCWEFVYETNPCTNGGGHSYGQNCTDHIPGGAIAQPSTIVAAYNHCEDSNSGSGPASSSGSSSSSGTSGSGTGSGTGGGTGGYGIPTGSNPTNPSSGLGGFITQPILGSPQFSKFINSISQSLKQFINDSSNTDFYTLLSNYFYDNNQTQEAKNFISWAIQFKMDNPNTTVAEFENWFIDDYLPQDIVNELQSYPCAQNLLQQLPTLSNDIAQSMKSIFLNNKNYNIIFRAKSGLGTVDGTTFSTYSTEFGTFKSVIYLNDNVLQNATKEYILVTMYHEVIHAFLDYEKFRLGNAAFLIAHPYVLVGYDYDANGLIVNRYTFLPQHQEVGAFLSHLENIIKTYNPNLPSATVKALAKAGITTMTPQEQQLNQNERDTSSNNYLGTKCP